MKKLSFLLVFVCAALFQVSCSDGGESDGPTPGISIEAGSRDILFPRTDTGTATFTFTSNTAWQITTTDNYSVPGWFSVSPTSGGAGVHTVTVTLTKANTGYEDRVGYIVISSGDVQETIKVTQKQKDDIQIDRKEFEFDMSGGVLDIDVHHNVEIKVSIDGSAAGWIEQTDVPVRGLETTRLRFNIGECGIGEERSGVITVSQGDIIHRITVYQLGYYASTDYSYDGKVTKLQSASVGSGVNIVIMGDGYTDRWFADGRYESVMREVADNFFSIEPYTSFREYFNVYMVNVVSKHEVFETSPASTTALGCFYEDKGRSSAVDANKETCQTYARKALTTTQLYDAVVIVIMNEDQYAGTCYMGNPPSSSPGDYGRGLSIAIFPAASDDTFEQLLHHEAGGHGFGKLGDEYFYTGTIPEKDLAQYRSEEQWGWWKNVDFTSDVTQVKWAGFISDSRYASEQIGCYEGACTYRYGAYRPTYTSIMDENIGGFNAPSREAIYIRIHKLAHGTDWQYDYEKFVEYDLSPEVVSARERTRTRRASAGISRRVLPPVPPVIIRDGDWR